MGVPPPPCLLPPLKINNQPLERVSFFKVLGLFVQDNLKWNYHIDTTTKKAAKRLHILRVESRLVTWSPLRLPCSFHPRVLLSVWGTSIPWVPPCDLVTLYVSLVPSILEYCCPVWGTSSPCYLSDKVEKIQRRALRILYPDLSYPAVLGATALPRLDTRRDDLCRKTFAKIADSVFASILHLTTDQSQFARP